jgi:PiT family inorganic phosphate transporter
MEGDLIFWGTIGFGLYMAWTIGANDVANAMGTSVGSGAITLRQALVVAAVFELAGAVLVGGHVTETVRNGIVTPTAFEAHPIRLALGMFSALVAASVWLHLATWRGWPVSTTHAIVGAVAGFGVVAAGWDAVDGSGLAVVASSWIVSPILGAVVAMLLFRFVQRSILSAPSPMAAMRRLGPLLVLPIFVVLTLAVVYKGLRNLDLDLPFAYALGLGLGLGAVAAVVVARRLQRLSIPTGGARAELVAVEKGFVSFQLMTACFVAFAHGSNDVANAVGPIAGVTSTLEHGVVAQDVPLPSWILWIGGVGIVVGLATYGYRVIATIGKKITELTPSRGFTAEFSAAATILLGSKLSLPISTTHTLVGAVVGVGMAQGLASLDLGVLRGIVLSWVVTVPLAALLSAAIYGALAAALGV